MHVLCHDCVILCTNFQYCPYTNKNISQTKYLHQNVIFRVRTILKDCSNICAKTLRVSNALKTRKTKTVNEYVRHLEIMIQKQIFASHKLFLRVNVLNSGSALNSHTH